MNNSFVFQLILCLLGVAPSGYSFVQIQPYLPPEILQHIIGIILSMDTMLESFKRLSFIVSRPLMAYIVVYMIELLRLNNIMH